MTLMLKKADWKPEAMFRSLRGDFSNATDVADDLVEKVCLSERLTKWLVIWFNGA